MTILMISKPFFHITLIQSSFFQLNKSSRTSYILESRRDFLSICLFDKLRINTVQNL